MILIPFFAVWFAEWSNIPQSLSNWLMTKAIFYREVNGFKVKLRFNTYPEFDAMPVRLLPFDCAKCLGFWLMVAYSYNEGFIDCLLMSGVSSLVAMIVSKLINKI